MSDPQHDIIDDAQVKALTLFPNGYLAGASGTVWISGWGITESTPNTFHRKIDKGSL